MARVRSEKWRQADPARHREVVMRSHYRRKYGITPADHERMYRDQGSRCALCSKDFELRGAHVDHDHESGVVRGLLCRGCNLALGYMERRPTFLARVIDYRTRRALPSS